MEKRVWMGMEKLTMYTSPIGIQVSTKPQDPGIYTFLDPTGWHLQNRVEHITVPEKVRLDPNNRDYTLPAAQVQVPPFQKVTERTEKYGKYVNSEGSGPVHVLTLRPSISTRTDRSVSLVAETASLERPKRGDRQTIWPPKNRRWMHRCFLLPDAQRSPASRAQRFLAHFCDVFMNINNGSIYRSLQVQPMESRAHATKLRFAGMFFFPPAEWSRAGVCRVVQCVELSTAENHHKTSHDLVNLSSQCQKEQKGSNMYQTVNTAYFRM